MDLGEIIAIIANMGVIAGIVFLAVEIRQNNKLLAAEARQSLRHYRVDIADTIMSQHVLEATHKYASGKRVSPAERSAALMTALKCIELWEWQYGEYVNGMLDKNLLPLGAWRLWYYGKAQSPVPIQEIWEMRKDVMNAEFVRFFEDNVIASGDPQPS